jgi:hypothetical protein
MVAFAESMRAHGYLEPARDRDSGTLIDLYVRSLFVDEEQGTDAAYHRLSAGVLRAVLAAMSQSEGTGQSDPPVQWG